MKEPEGESPPPRVRMEEERGAREEHGEDAAGKRGLDPWLRFTLVFGALAIASEILYYGVVLGSEVLEAYLSVLAAISGRVVVTFDPTVVISGSQVGSGFFIVDIAPECDAIQLCAMLVSAIVAFPAPTRSKVVGVVLSLIGIQLLNFARITSLYYIGGAYERHFEAAHTVWWPAVLIVSTVCMWIAWARRVTSHGGETADPPA